MPNRISNLNRLGEFISNIRVVEKYSYNFIQIINVRTQKCEEPDHMIKPTITPSGRKLLGC